MAASNKKGMSLTVMPDQIMYSGIRRSKDGFNSAGFEARLSEGEYVSVSYEWKGDSIPDFVFDLMGFIQSNKEEIDQAVAGFAEEFAAKKGGKKQDPSMMDEEDIMNDPNMTDQEQKQMLAKMKKMMDKKNKK